MIEIKQKTTVAISAPVPPRKQAKTDLSLKKMAKAAWQRRLENELEWEHCITRQMFALLERIYAICGENFEVNLILDDWQIKAAVDGLHFVSTYYEIQDSMSLASSETLFGLRLWWQCKRCKVVKTSGVIYADYDLGYQLEIFDPEKSHHCRRRSRFLRKK